MAVEIPLTKGYTAIVDDEDADLASRRWNALVRSEHLVYARRGHGLMHREIVSRLIGRPLGKREHVDHIDGNALNNRRENLRVCTQTQNLHNMRKSAVNTSGYKGVTFNRFAKKWHARIRNNGRQHHLGYYDTAEAAHKAYCEAADRLHGEFARHD